MKTLYITVGLPGSGKTTWVSREVKKRSNTVHVSRDNIRYAFIDDDEDYFSHEGEVYREFIHSIQEGLNNGYDVYADATHLNWPSRRKLLGNLDLKDVAIVPIFFNIPLEICIAHNNLRSGRARVPEAIITHMAENLYSPINDPFDYDDYIVITEKDM